MHPGLQGHSKITAFSYSDKPCMTIPVSFRYLKEVFTLLMYQKLKIDAIPQFLGDHAKNDICCIMYGVHFFPKIS